ncbi:MAG: DinB family protein [Armatimonadota bacterium]
MISLHDYLRARHGGAYRALLRSLNGLTEQQALEGASPHWKRYRLGTGLDGSIAGIVWHVAAWKAVAADGLDTGLFPDAEAVLPAESTWAGLLSWLELSHSRLTRYLDEAPPEALSHTVTVEGEAMRVYELFGHWIEHDQYHAGQVNLLRQQRGHTFPGEE